MRAPPPLPLPYSFFFFNDTATTEIYTLSLHDALPILTFVTAGQCNRKCPHPSLSQPRDRIIVEVRRRAERARARTFARCRDHTSELQSLACVVFGLLVQKKNNAGPKCPIRLGSRVAHP